MIDEMESIRDTVLKVAREKPYTRNSYKWLYFEVNLELAICKTSKKGGFYFPFKNVDEIVNPETVSRAYRKLKEEFPEIRPSEAVKEFREQNEQEMRDINIWWQPQHLIGYNKQIKGQTTLVGD